MIEDCTEASMAKIKRQLKFDSAVRFQQSAEQHLLVTPDSLQVWLDSSKGKKESFDDISSDKKDQLIIAFDSSSGKKTPVGEKRMNQEDISPEKQEITDSESFYSISPFSNHKRLENSEQKISKMEIEKPHYLNLLHNHNHNHHHHHLLPPPPHSSIITSQDLFESGKSLTMRSVKQLCSLKQIVQQKQYQDTIQQFQVPFKKLKRDNEMSQLEKENNLLPPPPQTKNSQIFNTEEKKIIYNEEYLQKLGLPLPESVLRQKMIEKERIRQDCHLKLWNIQDQANEQQYRKPMSLDEPLLDSKKTNKMILGIQGTALREKDAVNKSRVKTIETQKQQQSFLQSQIPMEKFDGEMPFNFLQQGNSKEILNQDKSKEFIHQRNQQNIFDFNLNQFKDQFMEDQSPLNQVHNKDSLELARKVKLIGKLKYKQQILAKNLQGNLADKFHQSKEECQEKQKEKVPSASAQWLNDICNEDNKRYSHFEDREQKEVEEEEAEEGEERDMISNCYFQTSKNILLLKQNGIKPFLGSVPDKFQRRQKLSQPQKKIVLIGWVKKNLQDLNYWIQKSKSELILEFSEVRGDFKCQSCIVVGFKDNSFIETEGFGNSKKDAKKCALERAAFDVIMNDELFWEGVTGRQYVENMMIEYKDIAESNEGNLIIQGIIDGKNQSIEEKNRLREFSAKLIDRQRFKIQKFMRQMQTYLRDNKIIDALEKLSQISGLKGHIGFNEMGYLWTYGAQIKNIAFLKTVLEIIHYRKFSSHMKESLLSCQNINGPQALQSISDTNDISHPQLEAVNKLLDNCLGITRCFNVQNPFEQINLAFQSIIPSAISQVDPSQERELSYISNNLNMISIRSSLTPVDSLSFPVMNSSFSSSVSSLPTSCFQSEKKNMSQYWEQTDQLLNYEWPSLILKREKINNIKSKTNVTLEQVLMRKDPYLHYLNWQDLNGILQSLLFTGDPLFSLTACELLFSYAKIDPNSLLGSSFSFFFKQKLTLFQEFIENLLKPIKNQGQTPAKKDGLLLLQGTLDYIGSNYEQDQMIFKVNGESGEIFPTASNLVADGDLCQLTSCNEGEVNNGIVCLVREVGGDQFERSFKMSMILSTSNRRLKVMNSNSSELFSLRKLASTKDLFSQSKALDQMCSKVSMLNSIFQKIISYDGTSLQPSRVSQEVNLQSILSIHSLTKMQTQALHSASTNDLTLVQTCNLSYRNELFICIMKEWLIQSNLKIVVQCESDYSANQFLQLLSSSFISEINYKKTKTPSTNICFFSEEGSAETFSSNTSIRQSFSASMTTKLKKLSDDCQVIILGGISANVAQLKDCQFNRVIILNSEQIPEQLTWQLLIRNCNQLVLLGDITQYQRKTTKSLLSKSRYGDSSLFERLIRFGIKPMVLKTEPNLEQKLNSPVHFEHDIISHQSILSSLHHRLFFESSSIQSPISQIMAIDQIPKTDSEVLVIALKGNESPVKEENEEFLNQIEAECVLGIVNSLVIENKVDISQIRVITPTKSQKDTIYLLSSNPLQSSLNVHTIEQPLNQSFEYLIFSGTRSNTRGEVGIARNPSVLSTLLQHTINQLIFIGDIDLYALDPTWRLFFETAFSKKQIYFLSPNASGRNILSAFHPKEKGEI